MNMLKRAVLGAAVASGVLMSAMGPAWARPTYETRLSLLISPAPSAFADGAHTESAMFF